jgi:hypothetical protein
MMSSNGKHEEADRRCHVFMYSCFTLFFLLLPFSIARASPAELVQQATTLIRAKVKPQTRLLEAWGRHQPKQATLASEAQKAIDLLNEAHDQASVRMKAIAAGLKSADDPDVKEWQAMDRLARGAEYTRRMTEYALALSMEPQDPRRAALVTADIRYLTPFDTAASGVQGVVRLRLARLHLLVGEHDQAEALLRWIRSDGSADQREDARRLEVISALAFMEGANGPRPNPFPAYQGSGEEGAILHYRLLLAKGDVAEAHRVLGGILEKHPELWPAARRRLIDKAGDHPAIGQLDLLTLRALMQRADMERQEEHPDRAVLERGLEAAKRLAQQSGVPAEVGRQAAILCPALLEKLGRNKEAAKGFIAYAAGADGAYRELAFDHARWLVGQLRQSAAKDPATADLWRTFLELAVLKLHKKAFAFDYAQWLESAGRFKSAADYYGQTPEDDSRYEAARIAAVQCLLLAHDPEEAARRLAAALPEKGLPHASAYPSSLRAVLEALDGQYTGALAKVDLKGMAAPAEARAVLTPRLAQWSGSMEDRLYDLDCRREAIELRAESAERQEQLKSLMGDYTSMAKESPTGAALGIALTHYALHQWQAAAQGLRPLLESGALAQSSPPYWEARYKLLSADWRLAGEDAARRRAVREDLKLLEAKWNGRAGGTAYGKWFERLGKEMGQ